MTDQTPWLNLDPFPEVPVPGTYGYLDGKKAKVIAGPIELREILEKAKTGKLTLAWTPPDQRVRPIYQIPFYSTEWEARERRVIGEQAKVGWFFLAVMPLTLIGGAGRRGIWSVLLWTAVLGLLPILSAWWSRRELEEDIADGFVTRSADDRFGKWLAQRRAPLGNWLAGALVLLSLIPWFAPLILDGESTLALAWLDRSALRAGEWWRALTVAGVHAGPMHLLMNAGGGAALLSLLERLTHRGTVALTYLAAVLAGSLASTLVYGDGLAVGASGGIMGLAGLLFAYAQRHRDLLPHRLRRDAVRSLIMTGLLGIVAWGAIDNAAHAGGALAGWLIGRWVDLPAPAEPPGEKRALSLTGAAATGVILFSWGLTAWLVWPR
jgi:membrane associated rhomboid family serine protease